MRFLDEYRDYESVQRMAREIRRITTRPWTIMEVCGGQTYTIVKSGLQELLPQLITLVHGPGCPVCVTPVAMIDRAVATALFETESARRQVSRC
jgi:hydrogenase expression/formation protein HypD